MTAVSHLSTLDKARLSENNVSKCSDAFIPQLAEFFLPTKPVVSTKCLICKETFDANQNSKEGSGCKGIEHLWDYVGRGNCVGGCVETGECYQYDYLECKKCDRCGGIDCQGYGLSDLHPTGDEDKCAFRKHVSQWPSDWEEYGVFSEDDDDDDDDDDN